MESGEQGTGSEVRPQRMLGSMLVLLAMYTAALVYGLFGNLQSMWLRSGSLASGSLFPAILLELVVLDRFLRGERSFVTALGTVLAYLIPAIAVDQYRWLDRFQPNMRERVPQLPWHPAYTLAFGIAVYVVLVVRAVLIYRNQPALEAETGTDGAERT